MTGIELVQEEAERLGLQISTEDADYILWEETGFPCYFVLDEEHPTLESRLRQQVQMFLLKVKERREKR